MEQIRGLSCHNRDITKKSVIHLQARKKEGTSWESHFLKKVTNRELHVLEQKMQQSTFFSKMNKFTTETKLKEACIHIFETHGFLQQQYHIFWKGGAYFKWPCAQEMTITMKSL